MWFTPNESNYLFKPEHEKIIKIYKEANKEFKVKKYLEAYLIFEEIDPKM